VRALRRHGELHLEHPVLHDRRELQAELTGGQIAGHERQPSHDERPVGQGRPVR